jgi:hypothetical protein
MTIMRKLHIIENAILYLDRVEETIDNTASLLRHRMIWPREIKILNCHEPLEFNNKYDLMLYCIHNTTDIFYILMCDINTTIPTP